MSAAPSLLGCRFIKFVVNIPIIAVFTKYDQLVTHFRQEHDPLTATESAEEKAAAYFNESAVMALQDNLKDLKLDLSIPCVQVAVNWNRSAKCLSVSLLQYLLLLLTNNNNQDPYQETLINLTKFTRNILQPVEHKLQVLWVAAQQVNALQKVEGSIRYCPSCHDIPESLLILCNQRGFQE